MAVATATKRRAVSASAMSPHSTTTSVPLERMRSMVSRAAAAGSDRALSTIRPAPAAAIFSPRYSPSPPNPPVMM